MARTSAKAKRSRQEVLKSKAEEAKKEQAAKESEDASDNTDKENDENYEVEKIIHSRIYRGKKQYLVRWKGFSDESDTWENESVLNTCSEVLEAFESENSKAEISDKETNGKNDENEVEGDKQDRKQSKKKITNDKSKKEKSDEETSVKNDENEEKSDKQDSKQSKKKITNDKSKKEKSDEEETEKDEIEKSSTASKKRSKSKSSLPPKKAKRDVEESAEESDEEAPKAYEVEKIVEVHTRKDGRREFLIRWKGYRPSEDTWEPEAHLDCPDLIAKFMDKVDKARSVGVRELRETRTPVDRFIPTTNVHGRPNRRRHMGFRGCYQE